MKRSRLCASAVAIVIGGCGGSGSDSPGVEVNPPAANNPPSPSPAPTPTPTTPVPVPGAPAPISVPAAPSPVTPPVDPNPTPAPPGSNTAPTPAPQPAVGTFIPGNIVRLALREQQNKFFTAQEVDQATGKIRPNGDKVVVDLRTDNISALRQVSLLENPAGDAVKYPYSFVNFPVQFSDEGYFALGRQITVSNFSKGYGASALVRPEGQFAIRDDFKFTLNTTAAEWKGVEGSPNFVQLQIATFSGSDTVFKICLHMSFDEIRRLACSLHNKDTGQLRGIQVIDDSRNIGPIEYIPVAQESNTSLPTTPTQTTATTPIVPEPAVAPVTETPNPTPPGPPPTGVPPTPPPNPTVPPPTPTDPTGQPAPAPGQPGPTPGQPPVAPPGEPPAPGGTPPTPPPTPPGTGGGGTVIPPGQPGNVQPGPGNPQLTEPQPGTPGVTPAPAPAPQPSLRPPGNAPTPAPVAPPTPPGTGGGETVIPPGQPVSATSLDDQPVKPKIRV